MEDNSKKHQDAKAQEQKTDDKQQTTDGLVILKIELEKCKKEAEEYLNGWKRAKADYINFKKETEAAGAELAQFASIGVMLKILPVYDGLKKACQKMPSTSPDASVGIPTLRRDSGDDGLTELATDLSPERAERVEGWSSGILNIKKQFEEVFKSFGVEEIKTVGEKFNPEFHEAVGREKKDSAEADIVVEEVSGGYTMNGKTIIPAKVIVNG